jgi:hypothetical protein
MRISEAAIKAPSPTAKPDTFVFLSWALILIIHPRIIQRAAISTPPLLQTPIARSLVA